MGAETLVEEPAPSAPPLDYVDAPPPVAEEPPPEPEPELEPKPEAAAPPEQRKKPAAPAEPSPGGRVRGHAQADPRGRPLGRRGDAPVGEKPDQAWTHRPSVHRNEASIEIAAAPAEAFPWLAACAAAANVWAP